MNEQAIKHIFSNYIAEKQDREYHSQACLDAENELETVMDKNIGDLDAWTEVITQAMSLANEYEQDGFVAGFQMAMQMFCFSGKVVA